MKRPCVLCGDVNGCNRVLGSLNLCDKHWFAYLNEAELGKPPAQRPMFVLLSSMKKESRSHELEKQN